MLCELSWVSCPLSSLCWVGASVVPPSHCFHVADDELTRITPFQSSPEVSTEPIGNGHRQERRQSDQSEPARLLLFSKPLQPLPGRTAVPERAFDRRADDLLQRFLQRPKSGATKPKVRSDEERIGKYGIKADTLTDYPLQLSRMRPEAPPIL